ncbi:MAG: redoxin family protein [Pirellulales bacterium]|nr:redoxin family protein [Pirellulales bacterium]
MRQSNRVLQLVWAVLGSSVLGAFLVVVPRAQADGSITEDAQAAADDNPYLAPSGLSTAELVAYLDKLRLRPETIRRRPGFGAALVETAERVLADSKAEPDQVVAARVAQLDGLAILADGGDRTAADRLVKLADEHLSDGRCRVANEARFHRLESLLLRGGPIDAAEVPKLLDEVEQYFATEKPDERHERLAIAAIRLLRSLENADEVNRRSQSLGKLLVTSPARKLARYGKRLSEGGATDEQTLVGQALEIEGATVDGLPFDWKAYRGRVVLVDFWATWCGPCKAELPQLKQAYDRLHDQGFDIVGISLDRDRAALEKFLAENPLGWPTLFHEGGQHPLAEKLGVRAIPFTLLVDRMGNIVAQNLRGPAIVEHVERLLGVKP